MNCLVTKRALLLEHNKEELEKFEEANGGTLFLDEIGELDLKHSGKIIKSPARKRNSKTGFK